MNTQRSFERARPLASEFHDRTAAASSVTVREAFARLPRRALATAVSAVLAAGGLGTAYGQDETETERGAARSSDEVIVTGTRIRRDDFTSPNATVTLTSQDMESLGISTVADMVGQMTSNVSNWQPDATGGSAFQVGATLANIRGMNTFFGTRTLTLVDSRRFVSTNNGGGVDLNVIPSALVGRMESVTGGASASYGADAISGVVNIILDKELEGVKIRSDFGRTGQGDGDNYSVSVAGGAKLLEGRGHVIVSYEQQVFDPILDCVSARDWCARSVGLYTNGVGAGGLFSPPYSVVNSPVLPGEPGRLLLENLRYAVSPNGTLYTNTDNPTDARPDLPWFEFNEAGTDVRPWDPGQFSYRGGATGVVVGGQGRSIYDRQTFRPEQDRDSFYGHFRYDIGERTQLFTDVSVSTNVAQSVQGSPAFTNTALCIEADNAFLLQLPAEVQAMFAARRPDQGGNCGQRAPQGGLFIPGVVIAPKNGATITKDWMHQMRRTVDTDTETNQIVIGASGALFDKWSWDVSFQYGATDRAQIAANYETNNRFAMALDSIRDSADGLIKCRVNAIGGPIDQNGNPLPGPTGDEIRTIWNHFFGPDWASTYMSALAPGCVPLNPFGQAASQQALDYVFGDLIEYNEIRQRVTSVTFSGEVAEGWAGPILLAAGIDHRYDYTRNFAADVIEPLRTDFALQYGDPWAGELEGHEIFTEIEVPLLADKPAARYMMLNVAARETSYESRNKDERGGVYGQRPDSWKASFVWDPSAFLRVRATRSSDVRSPSMRELFYRLTQPPTRAGFFGGTSVENRWIEAWNDANPGQDFEATDPGVAIIGANPNLENEVSITETFGLVLTPQRIPGLQLSIDYFSTALKGGITGLGPQDTIDGCFFENNPVFCSKIEFGPPDPLGPPIPENNLIRWEQVQVNQEPFYSSGFDLSASYNFRLGGGGLLSMRVIGTRMNDQDVGITFGARRNVAGQTGTNTEFLPNFTPAPEWSGNIFWTYMKNAFTFTAQARYVGKGLLNATTPFLEVGSGDPRLIPGTTQTDTIYDNTLPSWTTWNINTQYDLAGRGSFGRFEELAIFLRIDNVTDKEPIFSAAGLWSAVGGVNAQFFDTLGRNFQIGVNMQF